MVLEHHHRDCQEVGLESVLRLMDHQLGRLMERRLDSPLLPPMEQQVVLVRLLPMGLDKHMDQDKVMDQDLSLVQELVDKPSLMGLDLDLDRT